MAQTILAEKREEELAKMEQEIAAQSPEESEQPQQPQEVEEETTPEESAPSKEEETPQSPDEEEPKEDDQEATESDRGTFTEEEWKALGEKTKREFTQLREKARKADAQEERAEKLAEVYAPLKEVSEDIKKEAYEQESKANLPWRDSENKAAHWASRLMEDINYAEREYTELNPDSGDYDDKLTSDILQDFRTIRQSKPDFRLKDLVDRRMRAIVSAKKEAIDRIKAEREAEEETKKQKAMQAAPTNVSTPVKEVTTEDRVRNAKSIDELERLEDELGVSDRFN